MHDTESTANSTTSGGGWWGIIITIIVIIIVVIIATVVVWNQQDAREKERKKTALNLSDETDHLLSTQIVLDHSGGSSEQLLSPDDISLLLYENFSVKVPSEKVKLIAATWDQEILNGLNYNSRHYQEDKEYMWDLRAHLGLPLTVVVKDYPTGVRLPPPSELAVRQLHYLIKKGIVQKAHQLINEVQVNRYDLLEKVREEVKSNTINSVVGGYWWINTPHGDGKQIFRSKEYPEGVLAHGIMGTPNAYRINLLCPCEDFEWLLDVYKAHHLELLNATP